MRPSGPSPRVWVDSKDSKRTANGQQETCNAEKYRNENKCLYSKDSKDSNFPGLYDARARVFFEGLVRKV